MIEFLFVAPSEDDEQDLEQDQAPEKPDPDQDPAVEIFMWQVDNIMNWEINPPETNFNKQTRNQGPNKQIDLSFSDKKIFLFNSFMHKY